MLEKQKMCTSIRKPARDRNVRGVNYNRKLDELNKKNIKIYVYKYIFIYHSLHIICIFGYVFKYRILFCIQFHGLLF